MAANAGTATFGPVAKLDPVAEKDQVQLNVLGVHDLVLAVLPGMLARKAGGILISGSAAGNSPIPNNATYAATKAFANTFSESLRGEVKDAGVHVTVLAPGPVRTELITAWRVIPSMSIASPTGTIASVVRLPSRAGLLAVTRAANGRRLLGNAMPCASASCLSVRPSKRPTESAQAKTPMMPMSTLNWRMKSTVASPTMPWSLPRTNPPATITAADRIQHQTGYSGNPPSSRPVDARSGRRCRTRPC